MLSIAGFAITLFLGGWGAPFSFLGFVPSWAWFFLKLAGAIGFFIWLRGTMPRLRQDQLMGFAWKLMLPMALSAKLAVTCIGPTSSTIAFPDGARMPATTLTAVTVPSAGAVSVAAATWTLAWVTACCALVMDAWSDAIVEAVAGAVLLAYES